MRLPFALPVALLTAGLMLHVRRQLEPHSANDSLSETWSPHTRSRLSAAQVSSVMEHVGDRDLDIVQTLGRVRVASARQLERLHFVSSSPLSNARSARATLARLARWRVLARLKRRVGGVRAGSAGYVYALDVVGQRIIDRDQQTRSRRPWTPSAPFIDHALAVTELYVRLVEAGRRGEFELLAFDAEPACWRSFSGPGGERVTLKPDAYVRVGIGDFEELSFVEVDRATESNQAVAIKCDRYRLYWMTGGEQRRTKAFPRVVWLVPDGRRQQQLVDVAGKQPPEAWRLFKVAMFDGAMNALTGDGRG